MFGKDDKVIFIYDNSFIKEMEQHDGEIVKIIGIDTIDKKLPYLIEFTNGETCWVSEKNIVITKRVNRELDIGKIQDLF